MELVVQLMLVLALVSSFFQLSQWGLIPKLMLAICLGTISFLTYPWVMEQSRLEMSQWLADPDLMQQLATLQMVEALAFILVDLALIQSLFGQKVQKWIYYVGFYPGLMLLAAVLFLQMNSFYQLSHLLSFEMLGTFFAGLIALGFLLAPWLIQTILPEAYLRMELRYVLSFGQVLCSVIITVFCQKIPYTSTLSGIEAAPLLYLFTLVAGMFLLGWAGSSIKRKIKLKWKY